jgi:DNA-binding MarR family transcriptional regulator
MTPAVSPNDQASLQEQLVQSFSDFLPAWTKWLRTTLHQSGVTPARVRLLAVLADGPAVTMTSLSKALHVSPRNITTLVDALEAEGLVRRVDHPTDRRSLVVQPGPRAGEAHRLYAPYTKCLREAAERLSSKERTACLAFLEEAGGAARAVADQVRGSARATAQEIRGSGQGGD